MQGTVAPWLVLFSENQTWGIGRIHICTSPLKFNSWNLGPSLLESIIFRFQVQLRGCTTSSFHPRIRLALVRILTRPSSVLKMRTQKNRRKDELDGRITTATSKNHNKSLPIEDYFSQPSLEHFQKKTLEFNPLIHSR